MVAVGSLSFVNKLKGELGFKAAHREVTELGASYALREEGEAYGPNFGDESKALSAETPDFGMDMLDLRQLNSVRPDVRHEETDA